MSTLEELGEQFKDEDIAKYVSALFRAEEAFRKELAEYEKRENKNGKLGKGSAATANDVIGNIVSGTLFKRLPLKYRLALKLPWQYAIDTLTGFLKELGDGSTEDVLIGLAKIYMENLAKESGEQVKNRWNK